MTNSYDPNIWKDFPQKSTQDFGEEPEDYEIPTDFQEYLDSMPILEPPMDAPVVPEFKEDTQPINNAMPMTFAVMVDSKPHRTKPDDKELRYIKYRFANENECTTPKNLTATQLLDKICQGYTFCPAVIVPQQRTRINEKTQEEATYLSHCADGFVSQQLFTIDIDNAHEKEKDPATGKYRKLTVEEGYLTQIDAANICNANDIHPALVYHTFSSRPDFEKYRICVILNEPVTDNNERLHIMQTLISLFGKAADRGCTNADRTMHGSTPDCTIYVDDTQRTDKQVIIELWEEKCKKNTPPSTQNTIASLLSSPPNSITKLNGYNPSDYDADPNVLLGMINPNDCNYQVWTSICAAYKASGGTLENWMQWCSNYANDNRTQDRTTYNHLTGENSSIGTLKYYAGQLASTQYEQYKHELNARQQQAIADARQQRQQNTPTPPEHLPSSPAQKKPQAKLATEFGEFRPEFVWKPYIPKHEYTVLLAESGIGKTMFCCGVAAAISRGDCLPGEEYPHPAGKVLFISSEDSGACIRDRVIKSNANLENIAICDCSDSIGLSFIGEGMQNLRRIIQENNPELVIIDPWQAFVGETVDLNRMNQTRPILQSVAQLAKDTDCGIILISHVNKRAQGENANFAAAGSTELVNAARSAIKIEYDNNPEFPDDKDNRLAIHTKSNFSGLGRTVAYSTTGGFVTWTGFSDIDRNTIELAARMRKSVYDALKIQRADKADFTDLMRTIADLRAKSTDKTIKILYEELELYSNQGEAIWNGKNANQKSKILTSLIPTLKADYHLIVTVEPYPFQKACYDNQIRKGRGISVQIIPPNPNDNT